VVCLAFYPDNKGAYYSSPTDLHFGSLIRDPATGALTGPTKIVTSLHDFPHIALDAANRWVYTVEFAHCTNYNYSRLYVLRTKVFSTGVEETSDAVALDNSLCAQPNPFNPSTIFSYALSAPPRNASLTLYTLDGRRVAEFPIKHARGSIVWNASAHASGLFVAKLRADGGCVASQKIMLMK
jgi:hypothetical protein